MKVMIVTNIPNPYRIPLFNLLNTELAKQNVAMRVVFGAKEYKRRKFTFTLDELEFDYRFLKSLKLKIGQSEKYILSYPGIIREILMYKPHRIIVVGFSLATLKIWLLSFIKKTDYLIWAGTIPRSEQAASRIRTFIRKLFVKRACGFVAYGSLARKYLQSLGAPESKIKIAINTVDTEFFSAQVQREKSCIQSDGKKHLLYIGYLNKRKNVQKLMPVIKKLSEKRSDFIFDIIGDGEQRQKLEDYVTQNQLGQFVLFHGFKQKKELPRFLAQSDCLLFQTDFDIWGLVLNEAMAAGILCIASRHAGATQDLIIDGETGYTVDFEETEAVAQLVDRVLSDEQLAQRMKVRARKVIEEKAKLIDSVKGFKAVLGRC